VAPGILYRCILDPRGPWVINVVSVDLKHPAYALEGERAKGAFLGRERVSAMASRLAAGGRRPIVGINADFFDLRTGEVENNHVIRGEWVKGVVVTDSPHDDFDNAHTQFGVDVRGRPLIGRFELHGSAASGTLRVPLVGINFRPPRREGLVLYNPWYGDRTPDGGADSTRTARRDQAAPAARDSSPARPPAELRADSARELAARAARAAVEVVLRRVGRRADTTLYRVAASREARQGGGAAIPPGGAVLSATGAAATAFVQQVSRLGALVKVTARLGDWPTPPLAVVGGWPRVVKGGTNVGGASDSTEGTFPRFSAARHPRSALGITRDSSIAFFVVVDGRRPWSVGMSLSELGSALLSLGAWDAMNLDGGGSSALWIRGTVVNYPSDATGERPVGNGLFVVQRH
jgi:hypothetical protein